MERCRSGRTGRSRKPLSSLRGTEGSNPSLSAKALTFMGNLSLARSGDPVRCLRRPPIATGLPPECFCCVHTDLRRSHLLTKPLDQITAADIAELCVHGFEAIAVLLDVAIERGDITPPLDLAAGW